jgi:hypothetical protein
MASTWRRTAIRSGLYFVIVLLSFSVVVAVVYDASLIWANSCRRTSQIFMPEAESSRPRPFWFEFVGFSAIRPATGET